MLELGCRWKHNNSGRIVFKFGGTNHKISYPNQNLMLDFKGRWWRSTALHNTLLESMRGIQYWRRKRGLLMPNQFVILLKDRTKR